MWLYRTTWRRIGLISAAICIFLLLGQLFYDSWVLGTPNILEENIDDCKLGRTTPEELGYRGLTCEELVASSEEWWFTMYFYICFLSIFSLGFSIFAKEKISVKMLNAHNEFIDKELIEKLQKLDRVNEELSMQESRLRQNKNQVIIFGNERKNLEMTLGNLQKQHSQESISHASDIRRVEQLLEANKVAAEQAKLEYEEAENALEILKKHGIEQTTIIHNTNVSDSVIMGDFNVNQPPK